MKKLIGKLGNSALISRLLRRWRRTPEGEIAPVQEQVDLAITRVVASAIEANASAVPPAAPTGKAAREEKSAAPKQDADTDTPALENEGTPASGRLALWWAGLVMRIKSFRLRKTGGTAAETAADAFAWDSEPDRKPAAARSHTEPRGETEAQGEEEGVKRPFFPRLVAMLRRKPVWIGLAALAIGSVALTAVLALSSISQQGEQSAAGQVKSPGGQGKTLETKYQEMLEKNKKLEEENRKLLAARQHEVATASSTATGSATAPDTRSKGGDMDCSITNKESAAETLKRCIEEYNATSGR